MQTCSHSPIRTPPNAHCLPFPPRRTLHAPSGGSSTTLAARLLPSSPPRKGTSIGAFVLMRQPRVPPPPPPHRPDCGLPPPLDSPPPAAPPACSCAIHMPLSRLSALLGRFPPISPNVCTGAQRHHLPQADLTRPRRGEGGNCGAESSFRAWRTPGAQEALEGVHFLHDINQVR